MNPIIPSMASPRRFARRLSEAYRRFSNDDGFSMAAAMAYYVALSFFPLLLVLVAGVGAVLRLTDVGQDAQQQLLEAVEQQASPELSRQVERALTAVSEQAPASGPVGFLFLVIAAIAIFAQFDYAFDRIWSVPAESSRGWLAWAGRLLLVRLKALGMLVGVGAFLIVVAAAGLVWTAVQTAIEPAEEITPAFQWAKWASELAINVTLNLAAFAVIYRFVPKAPVRWRDALRGAGVAALLWEIGRQVLTLYLAGQGYMSAYGIIGSFLAIMFWAYYAMIVIFYGAEYTRTIEEDESRPR